jgi:hypothetical protein
MTPRLYPDPALRERYTAWLHAPPAERDRLLEADPELAALVRERARYWADIDLRPLSPPRTDTGEIGPEDVEIVPSGP